MTNFFPFRSLLPNFNTPAVDGQGGDAAIAAALADGNAAGAAGGEDEPRDLRRSVTTLLVTKFLLQDYKSSVKL